jgi:hypothetical protein
MGVLSIARTSDYSDLTDSPANKLNYEIPIGVKSDYIIDKDMADSL